MVMLIIIIIVLTVITGPARHGHLDVVGRAGRGAARPAPSTGIIVLLQVLLLVLLLLLVLSLVVY